MLKFGNFFGPAPLPDNRPTVRRFDELDRHDQNGLEKRLNRLDEGLRQQVVDCLQSSGLWGGAITNRSLLKAVDAALGDKVARIVKERALTDFVREGLSPEQVQRNLNYSRYSARRNEELGLYGRTGMFRNNLKPQVGINSALQANRSRGIADTGEKPSVAAKRPIL